MSVFDSIVWSEAFRSFPGAVGRGRRDRPRPSPLSQGPGGTEPASRPSALAAPFSVVASASRPRNQTVPHRWPAFLRGSTRKRSVRNGTVGEGCWGAQGLRRGWESPQEAQEETSPSLRGVRVSPGQTPERTGRKRPRGLVSPRGQGDHHGCSACRAPDSEGGGAQILAPSSEDLVALWPGADTHPLGTQFPHRRSTRGLSLGILLGSTAGTPSGPGEWAGLRDSF